MGLKPIELILRTIWLILTATFHSVNLFGAFQFLIQILYVFGVFVSALVAPPYWHRICWLRRCMRARVCVCVRFFLICLFCFAFCLLILRFNPPLLERSFICALLFALQFVHGHSSRTVSI